MAWQGSQASGNSRDFCRRYKLDGIGVAMELLLASLYSPQPLCISGCDTTYIMRRCSRNAPQIFFNAITLFPASTVWS